MLCVLGCQAIRWTLPQLIFKGKFWVLLVLQLLALLCTAAQLLAQAVHRTMHYFGQQSSHRAQQQTSSVRADTSGVYPTPKDAISTQHAQDTMSHSQSCIYIATGTSFAHHSKHKLDLLAIATTAAAVSSCPAAGPESTHLCWTGGSS